MVFSSWQIDEFSAYFDRRLRAEGKFFLNFIKETPRVADKQYALIKFREITMSNSIGSLGTPGFATAYQSAKTDQAKEVLMLKKMQDNQKLQGESAMKLLDSATSVVSASKIDVRV